MDASLVVGIVLSLAALWALLMLAFWPLRQKGVPVRELLEIVPDTLRLIRALIRDSSVALDVRLVLVGLLVWIVSPIDLIPEFIPVLGPLDDVVVAIVAMRFVRRRRLGSRALLERVTGLGQKFRAARTRHRLRLTPTLGRARRLRARGLI